MFKMWFYFLMTLTTLLYLTMLLFLNNFFLFFLYSEFFWILNFFMNMMSSSYLNEPRFLMLGFTMLCIAAVEIIFSGFYLSCQSLKNQ